jgi:hypothetical protein
MIRHIKEGNYLRNVWQEHICHLVNDEFLDVLGRASEDVRSADYLDMMGQLTERFRALAPECSPLLRRYFDHLDGCMRAWVAALASASG